MFYCKHFLKNWPQRGYIIKFLWFGHCFDQKKVNSLCFVLIKIKHFILLTERNRWINNRPEPALHCWTIRCGRSNSDSVDASTFWSCHRSGRRTSPVKHTKTWLAWILFLINKNTHSTGIFLAFTIGNIYILILNYFN